MPSTAKQEKILAGLRALCAEQLPGQSFSAEAIAQRCGCTKENIEQIQRKGQARMQHRLRAIAREHGIELPREARCS